MLLQPLPRRGEFGFELFHGGEGELIFAGHDFVRERVEGVAGEGGYYLTGHSAYPE